MGRVQVVQTGSSNFATEVAETASVALVLNGRPPRPPLPEG